MNILYKISLLVIITSVLTCSNNNIADCFKGNGSLMTRSITTSEFNKIKVNRNIQLILKQDTIATVIIESGRQLIDDVEAIVNQNELVLTDHTICNYTRDYKPTKVYVSAPNITHIVSNTQYQIQSEGVLNYANLQLISEDIVSSEYTVGDFNLTVNTENLRILTNNIASFYISGIATNLSVSFASGLGRFEGRALIAEKVNVFHRGSNDIIVNPTLKLTGELRSVGNLIATQQPDTVSVNQYYTGKLIVEN